MRLISFQLDFYSHEIQMDILNRIGFRSINALKYKTQYVIKIKQ
jgi:hypothetical protein